MLTNPFKKKPDLVDPHVEAILSQMTTVTPGSDEYTTLSAQLEQLMKIKTQERGNRISPDTWAIIGANLLGILVIVSYEHTHALTSKAMNQLLRKNP